MKKKMNTNHLKAVLHSLEKYRIQVEVISLLKDELSYSPKQVRMILSHNFLMKLRDAIHDLHDEGTTDCSPECACTTNKGLSLSEWFGSIELPMEKLK